MKSEGGNVSSVFRVSSWLAREASRHPSWIINFDIRVGCIVYHDRFYLTQIRRSFSVHNFHLTNFAPFRLMAYPRSENKLRDSLIKDFIPHPAAFY